MFASFALRQSLTRLACPLVSVVGVNRCHNVDLILYRGFISSSHNLQAYRRPPKRAIELKGTACDLKSQSDPFEDDSPSLGKKCWGFTMMRFKDRRLVSLPAIRPPRAAKYRSIAATPTLPDRLIGDMSIGKRVGFIGSGQMAEALARGLMEKGMITGDQISCSDPWPQRKELFKSFGETSIIECSIGCKDHCGMMSRHAWLHGQGRHGCAHACGVWVGLQFDSHAHGCCTEANAFAF